MNKSSGYKQWIGKIHTQAARIVPAVAIALVPAVFAAGPAQAQAYTESVLYNFSGYNVGGTPFDGAYPTAGLVRDDRGNLYGTTTEGGSAGYGNGTLFKLDPSGNETILHSFTGNGGDGVYCNGTPILDEQGNLYGTCNSGGASGDGTVYKISRTGNATVLHSFTGTAGDGANPNSALMRDNHGNLYGTTTTGGAFNAGTVFKLDQAGNETIIHSFTGSAGDGATPYGGLIQDEAGNLYGTTGAGGAFSNGTIYKIDKHGVETVLHSFNAATGDGKSPFGSLVRDCRGNLFGTTLGGGSADDGTVFELTAAGNETVLHSFTGGFTAFTGDGAYPDAGLVLDEQGNLYGITTAGGAARNGTVFKLDTSGNETLLYSFGNAPDGVSPGLGSVVLDRQGNLYGTTSLGGTFNVGTVFKLAKSWR